MNELYYNKDLTAVSENSVFQFIAILPDAAFVCDHSGKILACSDEASSFFNLKDKSKIIGSSFQSYISYESIEESFFLLSVVANENNSHRDGKFIVKKNVKDTCLANVKFSSVAIDQIPEKFVLITFRAAPVSEPGIEVIHRKDGRLARLCETVVSFTGTPEERIQKILSQAGETLGAITCTFNLLKSNNLESLSLWESPFNSGISPNLGCKQLYDYMTDRNEQLVLIKKPLLNTFLESESFYNEESGVKAILGVLVDDNNTNIGIFTAVFTFHYTLSEIDRQFILTISTLLSKESLASNTQGVIPEIAFSSLIDSFSDPVCILSPEAVIKDVNTSILEYYGYNKPELLGKSFLVLSAEEKNDKEQIELMFEKAAQGEPQRFEWWGQRKNGEIFPNELILNKTLYGGTDIIISISRDLSESKKAEQLLLQNNKELKESNVSKDKFLSILAHDLKNPFQGLLGFVDLLYEDLEELDNVQIKEYLLNVRNASYHIYAHLENLLAWSRIQSGKMPFTPTAFNINDEIQSVISVLEGNASQKGIKLFNEADQDIMVSADRNMIHSVLQNLITNSIKFSNTSGRVVVRCRVPQTYSKAKSSAGKNDIQFLEVSVSDSGIGIPEDILPKLFKLNGQYSQTGTANEPGTGLGLVLCHEMILKNGGKIWAESIEGQGTTFVFTVPISTQ